MRIELYTISWNEMRMLPYFLDYYLPWVDRIVVFDDASDDGTRERLAREPKVEVRPFPAKGESFVLKALELWNEAWKEARGRADWVLASNVDEYIWHRDGMRNYLARCDTLGATVVHPRGYEMVGADFPPAGTSLPEGVPRGVSVFGHDKLQLFKPDAIETMNYRPGRHVCTPKGNVVMAPIEAKLLHYKFVDFDGYHAPRQVALGARLLAGDKAKGMGAHYSVAPGVRRMYYDWLLLHATDVVN